MVQSTGVRIVYTRGLKDSFIVFHPCAFPVNEVIGFLWVMLNLYSPPPFQRFRKENKIIPGNHIWPKTSFT